MVSHGTFYFTNQFRHFYGPSATGVASLVKDFNRLPGALVNGEHDGYTFVANGACYDPGWITAENTYTPDPSQPATNPFITIAWFYKTSPSSTSPAGAPCPKIGDPLSFSHTYVAEQSNFNTLKFSNSPPLKLVRNQSSPLQFRYVIFPYKYDDYITYQGMSRTVADTIQYLKQQYGGQ